MIKQRKNIIYNFYFLFLKNLAKGFLTYFIVFESTKNIINNTPFKKIEIYTFKHLFFFLQIHFLGLSYIHRG